MTLTRKQVREAYFLVDKLALRKRELKNTEQRVEAVKSEISQIEDELETLGVDLEKEGKNVKT